MKLKELLIGVDIIETSTNMDIEIASIAYKAREVKQNSLFVAFSSFGN